jgi:hypothetical protein
VPRIGDGHQISWSAVPPVLTRYQRHVACEDLQRGLAWAFVFVEAGAGT